ncbi:ParA family protein [Caldilinea sp.]|uniref:ParA family protein n=1 Tax=Caldilinea sp. TaxID=2293560 RepID=UPI0021DBEEF8|nr:ParA family protein [Caldilinea sp.]GIV73561.1 MAG: hypothetical protein KatS3mg049_2117 [Caldilinea sp.]
MKPILAFVNHKGGSGKTTSAYYVATDWAARGIRTLAVDLDSQGTLSQRLADASPSSREPTVAELLAATLNREVMVESPAVKVAPCMGLLPADYRLGWVAAKMQGASPNHNILQRALRPLLEPWDAVILDCPPSADIVIINALVAASHVVICATPTPESWEGQARMRLMLADLADSLGQAPGLLGLVATQVVERAILHRTHLRMMGDDLLGTVPLRVGVNQGRELAAAYRPIADLLARELGLAKEAACSVG